MNGFKELHKHKIMHRDFKLANIFLNDDKLIIGDFGFAKGGVDMASTKLGSPITMAPELLLNESGKLIYTNKADLWSIGVCFFQMIFGRLPWDVKDMDELQFKVKTQSGSNLIIPTEICQISQECKDLLVRLLEQDPKARIEWDDLFNHKLFALHEQKKQMKEAVLNMKTSVMFRNNEDIVKKMFEGNKKLDGKEVELLVEPENITVESNNTPREQETNSQIQVNKIKARVISRYTHEKKTIVFFMYTCRRLRNLAKERTTFKSASNNLMYGAILLLKKGMIMNEAAVSSLKTGNNIYKIDGFEGFCNLEDCHRLRDELESKDTHLYNKLFNHLKEKMRDEVEETDARRDHLMKLINDPNCTVEMIDQELRKECSTLIPHFLKNLGTLPPPTRIELMLSLAHAYISAFQEENLSYLKDGVPFDWHQFDKSWNGTEGAEKINLTLNQAKSKLMM